MTARQVVLAAVAVVVSGASFVVLAIARAADLDPAVPPVVTVDTVAPAVIYEP